MEGDILFRGYIDDANNTDNAWVEAEVWYFHYISEVSFHVVSRVRFINVSGHKDYNIAVYLNVLINYVMLGFKMEKVFSEYFSKDGS